MATNKTIRDWLRQQGEPVKDRGRISTEDKQRYYAANPEGGVRLLPGPDDDLDSWEDLGVIGPESDPEPFEYAGDAEIPPEPPQPVSVDPEPAHARRDWRRQSKQNAKPRAAKVTAGIRGDINAKISLALEIPGQVWKIRDPHCGGTFVDQRPDIAEAFTDIVCDSADLVAFFTGPGGSFMKYLKLAAALHPVGTTMMAHHVYHTIGQEQPEDMQQPDYTDYAA